VPFAFVPEPPAPAAARSAPGTGLFSEADYSTLRSYYASRPALGPTPTATLPGLAAELGLAALWAKDETARFGLNAFKALGAGFAVHTLLARGDLRPGATVVCASEGNHGRAVARAARDSGCPARVYLAAGVAPARADAIAAEGAIVVRVAGTYDDAVRAAAADAAREGWTVISDTSWVSYEEIPRLIMLGYTRLMDELASALGPAWRPDAIFVPGGVGGLLAAVASWCARRWPTDRPSIVCVEPVSANCLQASARAGWPVVLPGPFDTTMGGLRCGEVSPAAFAAVLPLVNVYVAIEDDWTFEAMRRLARPAASDPIIHAGPSGAAALGGLLAVLRDEAMHAARHALGLGSAASAVVIVSEGVTEPDLWRRIVQAP
jgi:diaminopropionate ammonia-lyase